VLVVGDDRYNRSRLKTVTVVVLTSTARLASLPGNVSISAEVSGLDRDSVANVTQVVTVDREVLEERVGALPQWVLSQIEDGLRRALGL
jgi:mRNA interferase MazF